MEKQKPDHLSLIPRFLLNSFGFRFTAHPPGTPLPITGLWSLIENYYLCIHFYIVQLLAIDMPPGPHIVEQRWAINIQKGGVFFWILFLMYHYNQFNPTTYTYLSLHGVYGFCWLTKDFVFGDPTWRRKSTVLAFIGNLVFVLLPYSAFPVIMMHYHVQCSTFKLFVVTVIHTMALIVMMCSDCQKFYMIKYGKPNTLITNGFFKYSRNTNFLAEMILYSCYAVLTESYISWGILAWNWWAALFNNMIVKESFLRSMKGFDEYTKQSGFFFPKIV